MLEVSAAAEVCKTPHTAALLSRRSSGSPVCPPLTSVLLLHVCHQQGEVAVAGRQQGFDPALLAALIFGGKLVRSQSRVAPHQREGELLLGLTQLDCAALQDNHSYRVPLSGPVLVEQQVSLQHKPAFLVRGLYLTLSDGGWHFSDTSTLHNFIFETNILTGS